MTFGDNGARISSKNPNTKYNTEGNTNINHDELSFNIRSLNIVSENVNESESENATKRLVKRIELISVNSTYLLNS
jgi:hypothetical protein